MLKDHSPGEYEEREIEYMNQGIANRALLALAIIALLAVGGCQRSKKKVIGVIPKSQSHVFWQAVQTGAQTAGREFGVEILWNGPASEIDFSKQVAIVEDMINRRVDGIALAPTHRDALVPVVERATKAGIPVTIFDSGIAWEGYVSYVSTDNYKGGVVAAQRAGEILNGRGDVAILGVMAGSVSTNERENGFLDTVKKDFPNIKIVKYLYGMSDRAKSMAVAEDILTAHPNLDGFFCSNESSTVGAAQAIKSRGLSSKVKIVGFDSSSSLIDDLKAEVIDSLVLQNPYSMGYQCVKTLVDKHQGRPVERRIDTGVALAHRGNLATREIQELINPLMK